MLGRAVGPQVSEAKDLLEASVQQARMDATRLERESSSLAEQAKEERAHAQMLASKSELSKREMAKVYEQLEEVRAIRATDPPTNGTLGRERAPAVTDGCLGLGQA